MMISNVLAERAMVYINVSNDNIGYLHIYPDISEYRSVYKPLRNGTIWWQLGSAVHTLSMEVVDDGVRTHQIQLSVVFHYVFVAYYSVMAHTNWLY